MDHIPGSSVLVSLLQNSPVATKYFSGTLQTTWDHLPGSQVPVSSLQYILTQGSKAFLWHPADHVDHLPGSQVPVSSLQYILTQGSKAFLWHPADPVDHLPGSQVPVSSLQYSPMLGQSSGTLHATRVGWARTAATKCLKLNRNVYF